MSKISTWLKKPKNVGKRNVKAPATGSSVSAATRSSSRAKKRKLLVIQGASARLMRIACYYFHSLSSKGWLLRSKMQSTKADRSWCKNVPEGKPMGWPPARY